MDSEDERLRCIRWCHCGQPWIPAYGLYGTTEETECAACVLRRLLADERERTAREATTNKAYAKEMVQREKQAAEKAKRTAFAAALEECEAYSKGAKSEEAKAVAMNLAVRITQRAKQ